ncbi:MAG: TA system VapC family ribonuclease toxin [Dehalococcoidia bacterium]
MLVPDVNVLINAENSASPDHEAAREWMESRGNGLVAVAIPDMVLFGFVRITTNPAFGANAQSTAGAFEVCRALQAMPAYQRLVEGSRHWEIFRELSLDSGRRGGALADAYLAAFAIENDATFVTFDRGFARFPGLKVHVPTA